MEKTTKQSTVRDNAAMLFLIGKHQLDKATLFQGSLGFTCAGKLDPAKNERNLTVENGWTVDRGTYTVT